MESTDFLTDQPLPSDAIRRVLFVYSPVRMCLIPPATTTKGYYSASWYDSFNEKEGKSKDPRGGMPNFPEMRVQLVETAIPDARQPTGEQLSVAVVYHSADTGELFAAAPYTSPNAVESSLDSKRAFAVAVRGARPGEKAMFGMIFEDSGAAFDFSIALQQARKTLGFEPKTAMPLKSKAKEPPKKDFSLKEGETITVNIAGMQNKGRRDRDRSTGEGSGGGRGISLPPPPGQGFLAPPPSAEDVKAKKRPSQPHMMQPIPPPVTDDDNGFDDGEFGEFQ